MKLKHGAYLKFDRPGPVKVVSKENADQECVVSFCHIQGNEFAIRNIHRDYVVCLAKSSSSNEEVTDTNVVVKKDKECNENEIGFLVETKGSRIALRSVAHGKYLAITKNDNELVATDEQSMAMYHSKYHTHPCTSQMIVLSDPQFDENGKPQKSKNTRSKTYENQASPALSARSGIETPSTGAPTPGGNASLLSGDGDEPMDLEPTVAQNITPQRSTPIDNFIRPRVLGGTGTSPLLVILTGKPISNETMSLAQGHTISNEALKISRKSVKRNHSPASCKKNKKPNPGTAKA